LLLTGCLPSIVQVPVYGEPTAVPTVAPTPRPSCEEAKRRACQELAVLVDELLNEVAPLCRVKGEEWCAESIVDLGRRARGDGTSDCGSAARNAAVSLFRETAILSALPQGKERDDAMQRVQQALDAYNDACFGQSLAGAPTPTPSACQYAMAYVSDMTIPDDTVIASGASFVKTWAIRNSGSCAWDSTLVLKHVSGARLGAPASVAVPEAARGETVEVSASMEAPQASGRYVGTWQLCGPAMCYPSQVTVQIIVPSPR
jgi:hypothetical protein